MAEGIGRKADVWALTGAEAGGPAPQHLLAFLALGVVGTIVGTLGLVSLPSGVPSLSSFWLAMTLQVVGGLWFGGYGVLAGTLVGFLSNVFNDNLTVYTWGFLPANFVQSWLTAWVFRRFRLDPSLPTKREVGIFVLVGPVLSNAVGASLALAAMAAAARFVEFPSVWDAYGAWFLGTGIPCLLFGIPLLRAFSPQVVDSPFFCKRWWGGSRPITWRGLRFMDLPVAARLLVAFFAAGVLPILILGAAETWDLMHEERDASGIFFPFILNASVFLSLIVAGLVARTVKGKLGALEEGARRLGEGDLAYRVPALGRDEYGRLGDSFNRMAGELAESREELKRNTAERERYRRELEIASEIQQSLLPEDIPAMESLSMAAHSLPARVVGGDFYDFIPLEGGRWGILIADVSGKGVPAALFTSLSRSLIRVYASEYEQMGRALKAFNAYVSADNRTSMFVTLFCAVLDPTENRFAFYNAGHNPPLLFRANGGQIETLKATGMPAGLFAEDVIKEGEASLEPGDTLLLYTDGVTEAFNEEGDMFGEDRLIEHVQDHIGLAPRDLVESIEKAVANFVGNAPQSDDMTMVVIEKRPPTDCS